VTTLFVTHDQEEALEVADSIVVIAGGTVQQVGPPDQLYDAPANDFVMSFLGPVTRLGGEVVRPHDIDLVTESGPDTVEATVVRVVRLGFEIRVDLLIQGEEAWVQLTRSSAERLVLAQGATVYARRATSTVPSPA
jgi:sulfate transport system ATP-binding protein